MKTIKTDMGRLYEAVELTREQAGRIGAGHENVSVYEYTEGDLRGWEVPEGYAVISIDAEGEEPLGDILAELREVGYDAETQGRPEDTGYDTNTDGVGLNSVFAVVKK